MPPKAAKDDKPAVKPEAPQPPKPLTAAERDALTTADIKRALADMTHSAETKELRFVARAFRQLRTLRRRLSKSVLATAVARSFPPASPYAAELVSFVALLPADEVEMKDAVAATESTAAADVAASSSPAPASAPAPPPVAEPVMEAAGYLHLLVLVLLLDRQQTEAAGACAEALVKRLNSFRHHTCSQLASKAYFYYARTFELRNRLAELRPALHAALRTATLHNDHEAQATLLNLLLRSYLEQNQFELANMLLANVSLKESALSNGQYVRYLYYIARIKAVMLDYAKASEALAQVIAKAPTSGARGFRLAATKLSTIVQLLIGELPERATFSQAGLSGGLRPYALLTQAVHVGDLKRFNDVRTEYASVFVRDHTAMLIQRLRLNVIKTGLRKISVSYSRISLADIASKLALDSIDDAEFIASKAIRDGVISGVIDHDSKTLTSLENPDVYWTQEPAEQFHKRIEFCIQLHNEAVQAMRFTDAQANKPAYIDEEALREMAKVESEIASLLEEEEDD